MNPEGAEKKVDVDLDVEVEEEEAEEEKYQGGEIPQTGSTEGDNE